MTSWRIKNIMQVESQFIEFMCQASLGVCENSIKSRVNKGKLRKKIQKFAKTEFDSKFYHLDLTSEIDYGGLTAYLKNSLIDEIENYIAAPSDGTKKTIITKACNEAKADNRNKKAIVIAFIESIIVIMKQDFISNIDKSFKIFAYDLKDNLFNDIKSEILKDTNKITERIDALYSTDKYIVGNQAIEISQLSKISDDVDIIKTAIIEQQTERNAATNASISSSLDLLRDFGVSVGLEDSIKTAIKYSSKSEVMSIKFCIKREGRIANFNTTNEYLADLNYTMDEDTVDVVSSVIIQNGKKTEHNYYNNYTGAVCYLPWLSFTEMELYSSGLDRFTNSQWISSKLTIVPKQMQVTYNIESNDHEILWYGVRYKLHRSTENSKRCCYYENEPSNSKIRIDIRFAYEVILQDGENLVMNPQPDIDFSILPLDKYNARSQLEYYQALIKLNSAVKLKFVNTKTTKTDFSCGVNVHDLSENEIEAITAMYKKIIDIEEYFKVEVKLEFPIDSELRNYINLIHGLIMNKKVTIDCSSISITTHSESLNIDIGSSFGWLARANINKQLFDKELPIENVVMICPNTKYINQDGDSAVLEIVDKTILFWDTEDKVYSNLYVGFSKVLEIVGYD